MKKNLTTEAGPKAEVGTQNIDAINQVFAIFRRNYHNQYFRAYANEQELAITKRLWLDALQAFSAETIAKAARGVIETSEFLPTLHTMLRHCQAVAAMGLPDPHDAYREACQASSPKSEFKWSHPAVYHAGKACDWFFLANNSESTALPIFKEKYAQICAQITAGHNVDIPKQKRLDKETVSLLSKEQNNKKLAELRKRLNI